jgi:hypothetical protein
LRLSQFHELMADEFGKPHSEVIIRDFALLELGDKTAATLLAAGQEPREIWLAICRAQQVPQERWNGLDKKAKKQHAE